MGRQDGDPIDSVIDESAIEKQFDDIDKLLDNLANKLNNFPKATIFDGGSAKQLAEANNQAAASFNSLKTATQAVSDRIAQLNGSSKEFTQVLVLQTQAQKNASDANLADTKAKIANEAALKKQTDSSQKLTQEQKLQKAVNDSVTGSYNQLNAQFKLLTLQYKNLTDAERASPFGKQMAVDIATTNAQLKILDAGLGNYQRNVGNYNNSLGLLSKGIKGVGGLGAILSKSLGIDPEIAHGIEEVGRAIRDLQHARELQETGLEAEGKLYEINKAKIEATAAALDGETISKEVSIEANTALATSTEAAGVAQGELALSSGAVGTALEAEAVAADTAAISTDALSKSIGSGLVGGAVLALGAIVALFEAIKDSNEEIKNQEAAYTELQSIIGEITSAARAYEELREVNAQKELKDLSQQIDLRKAAGVSAIESLALDKQVANAQLKTANDQAAQYNINKTNVASAKADALASATLLKNAELEKQNFLKKTGEVEGQVNSFIVKAQLEATNKKIEGFKKEADATKSFYEFINGIFKKVGEAQNKLNLFDTQTAKLNADERRALVLAEATAEADIITNKNKIILSDERSSLNQRLAAIKSNSAQQLAVINATLQNTLTDPTKNNDPLLVSAAQVKANADKVKNNQDTTKLLFDTNETYRKKELKAQNDFNNEVLTEDKVRLANSLTDRFTDLQSNLDAIQKAADDQNAILKNNFELTKATTVLSQTELKALTEKYNGDILATNIDTENKLVVVQEKSVADQVAALKYLRDQRFAIANDNSQIGTDTKATDLINKAVIDETGKTAAQRAVIEKKLQRDLLLIDKKGQLDRLAISDDELKGELDIAILMGNDTTDIEAKITANKRKEAELRKGISDDEYKHEQLLHDKKLELRNQLEDAFQSIVESGFDKTKLQNDAEIKNIQDKSKLEIDAVNASGLAVADKLTRVAAIQKQADFQQQQIEKRQKASDLQRAKFEKAMAIARIIQNTAAAVTHDLIDPLTKFLVPYDIAIGAAQLAVVIAQPLPKYKEGTKSAKKGPSLVSEEGPELLIRNGQMFLTPQKPTLIDLAGGENIFKHDVTMDMLKHNNMLHILAKVRNAKQPERIETNYNEKMYKELRSLNGKPPFVISVAPGLETTDWFKKHFKN